MIRFKKSVSKNSSASKHRRPRIYNEHLVLLFYRGSTVISLNEIFTTFIFSDSDANKLSGCMCEQQAHGDELRLQGLVGEGIGGVITEAAGSDG